jgi:hypothetical protein
MTGSIDARSRATNHLLLKLGLLGFEVPDEMPPMVLAHDGYVINTELGIWVHADADMIRLVVEDRPSQTGYRLVLCRGDLRPAQALDIIVTHTHLAVTERRSLMRLHSLRPS